MKQKGIDRPSYAVVRILHQAERRLIIVCGYARRATHDRSIRCQASHTQRWYQLNFYYDVVMQHKRNHEDRPKCDMRVFQAFKAKPVIYRSDIRWQQSTLLLNLPSRPRKV